MSGTPEMTTQSFLHDNLMIQGPTKDKKVIIASGQGVVKRGSLLGQRKFSLGIPVFTGTGNGTLNNVAMKDNVQIGTYTLECISTTVDGGVFKVVAPNKDRLEDYDVAVGGAYGSDQIDFDIADGGTDFAAGDKFTIPVSAGDGKHVLSVAASSDGSQKPDSILTEEVDATTADQLANAYATGEFNERAVIFGTGHTAASVKDELAAKQIYLRDSVPQ